MITVTGTVMARFKIKASIVTRNNKKHRNIFIVILHEKNPLNLILLAAHACNYVH